ncbi:hypothetical protein [Rubrivirga sp.]|uniref:hypothetical protein n=1 Tax=Rubrivirga sp. TaxID=1885344 RepID=UPI003C78B85F
MADLVVFCSVLVLVAGCAAEPSPSEARALKVTDPVLEDDRSDLEVAQDEIAEAFGLDGGLDCPESGWAEGEVQTCTADLEGEPVPVLVRPDSTAPGGVAWMLDGVLLREHTERNMEEQLATLDGPVLEVGCEGPAVRPAVAGEVLSCQATDAATGEVTTIEASVLEAFAPQLGGAVSWSFDGALYAATPESAGSW